MKIVKAILIFGNAILLVVSVMFFIGAGKRKKEVDDFYSEEYRFESFGNEVNLIMPNETSVILQFNKDSVKVKDSYLQDDSGRVYIVSFIYRYGRNRGDTISRPFSEMLGEFSLHNVLYRIGYKREQTADADLNYVQDDRWYVNFFSRILY